MSSTNRENSSTRGNSTKTKGTASESSRSTTARIRAPSISVNFQTGINTAKADRSTSQASSTMGSGKTTKEMVLVDSSSARLSSMRAPSKKDSKAATAASTSKLETSTMESIFQVNFTAKDPISGQMAPPMKANSRTGCVTAGGFGNLQVKAKTFMRDSTKTT